MAISYHIDPSRYTLQEMKKDLLNRDLIPSRQSLKEDIDLNFQILHDNGTKTLGDLIAALKIKSKIGEFSSRSGIREKYLILLRREANNYLPNPAPLKKMSGFDEKDIN